MNDECVFIYRTYHIVSWRFTILIIEWDRKSACDKGASGSRYQFIFDLTHPPNPCMKCRIDHSESSLLPSILGHWIDEGFTLLFTNSALICFPLVFPDNKAALHLISYDLFWKSLALSKGGVSNRPKRRLQRLCTRHKVSLWHKVSAEP